MGIDVSGVGRGSSRSSRLAQLYHCTHALVPRVSGGGRGIKNVGTVTMSDQINANGKPNKPRIVCAITGKELSRNGAAHLDAVRPSLVERMRKDHPDLKDDAFVSRAELDRYRSLYVTELLRAESGDLSEIENQVAQSLATHETLAENVEEEFSADRSLGERLSDALAFWRQLEFPDRICGVPGRLDALQFISRRSFLRSLSVYSSKSYSFDDRRDPGADHHDEPEATGDEGQACSR